MLTFGYYKIHICSNPAIPTPSTPLHVLTKTHFLLSLSLFHKYGSHTHPRADTHGCDTNFLSCPSQLIEERRHLSSSGATQWMTEGNCTPIGIDLVSESAINHSATHMESNVPSSHLIPTPLHTTGIDWQKPH